MWWSEDESSLPVLRNCCSIRARRLQREPALESRSKPDLGVEASSVRGRGKAAQSSEGDTAIHSRRQAGVFALLRSLPRAGRAKHGRPLCRTHVASSTVAGFEKRAAIHRRPVEMDY